MSESERFRPTLKQAICENALVGLGILVLAPVIIWLRRGFGHWVIAVGSGAGGAFLVFLFYSFRFLWRAPRSVRFSDAALILERRDGTTSVLRWDEVRRAKHTTYGGWRWRLWTDGTVLQLRDDGFSVVQWEKISTHISAQLKARDIPITMASR